MGIILDTFIQERGRSDLLRTLQVQFGAWLCTCDRFVGDIVVLNLALIQYEVSTFSLSTPKFPQQVLRAQANGPALTAASLAQEASALEPCSVSTRLTSDRPSAGQQVAFTRGRLRWRQGKRWPLGTQTWVVCSRHTPTWSSCETRSPSPSQPPSPTTCGWGSVSGVRTASRGNINQSPMTGATPYSNTMCVTAISPKHGARGPSDGRCSYSFPLTPVPFNHLNTPVTK